MAFSRRLYNKIIRELTRFGIAQRISFTLGLHLGGRTYRIPIVETIGASDVAMADWWALEILTKLLPVCPGAVLDVGANVGQTLLKVKTADPDRHWLGFEPNPVCVAYLQRLIDENRFANCTVIPAGLDTETGVKALDCFTDDPADKTASLVKDFRADHTVLRRRWVPVLSFAALQRAGLAERIGFVKIDVEGGEKEVLESLQDVLAKDRPCVLLEILPVYSAENRQRLERQEAVEAQLRGLGYAICRVAMTPDNRCAGLLPLTTIGIHDQLVWSDYLVVPSERLEAVLSLLGRAPSPAASASLADTPTQRA